MTRIKREWTFVKHILLSLTVTVLALEQLNNSIFEPLIT